MIVTHIHAAWRLSELGFKVQLDHSEENNKPFWCVLKNDIFIGMYTTPKSLIALCKRIDSDEKRDSFTIANNYCKYSNPWEDREHVSIPL